ncbi:MAG TPA: helix-turn-helix transcriptional regulator [Phycisphaerae bacterium]|nr:helix-turn-helix transcriptional regulator [Phycisphaerae bacterium]
MKTGSIIRLLRTAEGISQGCLAEKVGIARAYLSAIENGHKPPSLTLLRKFSQVLGVPTALLLGGEDYSAEEKHIADELMRILGDLLAARLKAPRDRQAGRAGTADENEASAT